MGVNFALPEPKPARLVEQTFNPNTASQLVLAADPERAEGSIIYNNTDAACYINLGAEAATTADIYLPNGSNYELPDSYLGAVQLLSASTVTAGTILVQAMTFTVEDVISR